MRKPPRSISTSSDYKLKAHDFPPGLVLLQDTREQLPLFGPRLPKGLVICSTTLSNGDYSLMGFEDKFCIERKGISDLISYCTTEKLRTKAKMNRFLKMEWVGLIIEASERELYHPYQFSQVSPESIRQSLVSFSVRYGVHVYINADRVNLSRWLLDHAIKYYKIKREA